ncbi:MAG: GAF domain-containing protein, partial [Firmicutes bacterium]|nr:GAF domain-containing protein [Bacillota bacterium]
FVFQRLYETGDVYSTMNEILGEVGRQLNVSRVYIFENNSDNTGCSNTFEWCNQNIKPAIRNLQNISYTTGIYKNWPDHYDEDGVFYCADVSQLNEEFRHHLEAQNIKSMLHSAILDNGVFRGFIGFDECVNNRIWTTTQIHTLVFLSKILAVFLLKKRSQDATHMLANNLKSILDNQNAWIYVIDPETFRLRYINQRTRNMSPVIREGAYCYEVLMNRSACCPDCPARNIMEAGNRESFIHNTFFGLYVRAEASKVFWNGQESCLVTCRQVFQ